MARRPINRLTSREAVSLKVPGRYADGAGLYLHVDPPDGEKAGSKRWVFVFQWQGKRREMGLGPFNPSDIKSARDARDEARRQVAAGQNPIDARKAAAVVKDVPVFGDFAKAVVEGLALKSDKHRAQWRRTLTDYIPTLQALAVDAVSTQDVLEALKPHWKTIPETAERIRGRIERVLDAARAAGHISGAWENPARWKGHLALLLPRDQKTVRHHPAMPYADLPAFMTRLRARPSVSARALEFTILTAARTNETRFAERAEVSGDIWTVPAGRMKMGKVHRVPLTKAALDVLDRVRPPGTEPGEDPRFLFPNRDGGALSNMAMDRILRLGGLDVTVHGFRSTFKDWAEDCTNFANGTIEAALAHQVGDETERAYRRGDALEKRRRLMEAWEGFCAGRSGKVVSIGQGRRR